MTEKELSFEQAMARLEEIAAKLESGKTPLDESLKLFEEGTSLMGICSGMLDAAEQKVTMLLQSGEE